METSHFQISVVSADQRLPSQTVEVEAGWTTIDLKRHLSKVYPGEPPIDSQKLIFAGRILPDNSELSTLIGQEPFSKIVHLVLSPSVANQAKAAMATKSVSEYTPDELKKLQEQYLKYLNDYYRDHGAAIPQFSFAQHSGDNRVINVEIGIEDNVEPAEEPEEDVMGRNILQRFAGAFGFRVGAADGVEAMDARNDGEEGFDLFDFAYAIFRTSLIVAICVTYASWQRLALVFTVGLYFYWRNGARQLELRQQQQLRRRNRAGQPQPPPPQRQEQQPQTSNESQASRTETVSTTAAGHPPSSEASPGATAATTGSEQQQQQEGASEMAAEVEQGRVTRLVQSLRFAGSTSVRLVCAIFSSLVPELPPAGRFD